MSCARREAGPPDPSGGVAPSRRRRDFLPRLFHFLPVLALALLPGALGLFAAAPVQAQDDNRPAVQFAEVTYVIQEDDTAGLNIAVTISPALSEASRVKFTTSGHGTRNVDYTVTGLHKVWSGPNHWSPTTEYVDLPAGATQVLLKVRARQDKFAEGNENAVLSLTSIDTANAPYKMGNPASTEIVMLDNTAVGIKQDHVGVSGALPWTATLKVKDVSLNRGSSPMVVRKQKSPAGQYIACSVNTDYGEGIFGANERCLHGFVYERVALVDENGDSSISGTTSFPMLGCRNGSKNGGQCLPNGQNALSDNGFVHSGVAYRVQTVTLTGETLTLGFDRPIPDSLKSTLALTVDGSTVLQLADASDGGPLQWSNTGLSWSVTNPVSTVSLSLAAYQGGEGPSSGEEEQRDPLTASFENVPAKHDGQSAFTLDVRLSETVGKFSRSPRASSFAVTQGRVTGVEQVGAGLWRVTVQPASSDEVTVTLAGGRDCDDEPSGAVCAPDGRALSNTSTATVGGPTPQVEEQVEAQPEPEAAQTVTVAFGNVPSEHDGRTAFALEVQSGSKPAAEAFKVTAGKVTGVESLDPVLWRVRVAPKSWKDVTVALGAASATVPGPARIRVEDARAKEGKDASLDFAVTLSRAATGPVSVDYATKDGTAAAGADYTAASGTLTFAVGETAKTVSVALLDDAIDEGKETFTLELSNPKGAYLRKMHREAEGVIKNDDPLQAMWLARFGRMVASDAVGAVTGRFDAPRTAGSHLTFAGQRLDLSGAGDGAGDGAALANAMTGLARAFGAEVTQATDDDPFAGHGLSNDWNDSTTTTAPHAMTGRELLLGTSFRAVLGQGAGSQWTSWGQGASVSHFSAAVPGLSLTGESATGSMGMDYERGRLLAGFAMTHSVGEGTASDAEWRYALGSTATMMVPYGRFALTERLSAWTLAGTGAGTLTLDLDGSVAQRYRTDLAMTLAAAGVRGDLLTPEAAGGFALALKADAFWVRTESDRVTASRFGGLMDARGESSRVRAMLDGSRTFSLAGGATLAPSVALGVRHDGGDAETGTGLELGAGLGYADPSRGLDMALRVHGLAVHAEDGYDEWGVSGQLRLVPGGAGRGLSASLTPSFGVDPGGSERLWALPDAQTLAANGEATPSSRLDTEVGYGLAVFGGGFTGTPNVGFGLSDTARDLRLGWRLTPAAASGGTGFELSVDATRREAANAAAEHGVMLRSRLRW